MLLKRTLILLIITLTVVIPLFPLGLAVCVAVAIVGGLKGPKPLEHAVLAAGVILYVILEIWLVSLVWSHWLAGSW